MDDASMNHYEKQLYSVFKTFDVDNEEALDRSAINKLCDALQLEDRGAALVNTLFECKSDRVTFAQFRNGLLAVLGGAGGDPARALPATPEPLPQPDPSSHHSDDDSSGREVAPKFVFGSKKYGRRSRPPRAGATTDEPPSPRSSSASRLDTDDKRARQRMRCRRSASAMESRDDDVGLDGDQQDSAPAPVTFEHDRRIDRDEAFALCRGLNMEGIDRRLVERIFDDTGTTDTTVGEFFDRLNASLTTSMEEATREVRASTIIDDAVANAADDEVAGGLSSELVLEAWQRAGVQQPRRLLAELGFGGAALRPRELERALDDELRALPEPPAPARLLLLLAALALARLRLELARRRADLAAAERDKLRADVAEANRHARVLAQEVDESHARIEADLKASLRRAEARYAETTRQTAAETAAERERAAAALARLEADVARRAEAEARLRGELGGLRARVAELEARAAAAEARGAEAERERARVAGELRDARAAADSARAQAAPAQHAALVRELRRENQQLRDRNDELCAALEEQARAPPPRTEQRGGDLSSELDTFLTCECSEECDSSPASIDQRILYHMETVAKLKYIFANIDEIPNMSESDGQTCASCAATCDAVRRVRDSVRGLGDTPPAAAHAAHAAVQTDALPDAALCDAEARHKQEKLKMAGLIKDLESSLEQMKAEYDKSEEYWSGKLEEERDAFGEEQRLGDERLAELVAKIGEYERQFAAPALPTIDERHSLEAQFTDLEDEFARYRRDKEAELARALERLQQLERRLEAAPPAPEPREAREPRELREVRELRARTARAEAAARRLAARLAAADLLVKDLYVENCQLAHRRPL